MSGDLFLDGAVRVRQSAAGYRAGADAVFLAAALDAKPGDALLELGCGAGAALLMAAHRHPDCRFTGLERDPEAAALARENAAANGMADRVEIVAGDVESPPEALRTRRFDHVFFNPPFYAPGEGRAPAPERRGAYLEGEGGLAAWIDLALRRAGDSGRVTLIHRAERLDEILALLRGRAGALAIKPLAPSADAAATRVIVSAKKGSGAPLRLLPPLVLHADSAHSAAADAILRGRASLDLNAQ